MANYVPWVIGGVAVVGILLVMQSNQQQQLANTNIPPGAGLQPDTRSTADQVLSGLGSLIGAGASSYVTGRQREQQQQRQRENSAWDRWVGERDRQNRGTGA